jgi:hypothetical protein
MIDDALKKIKTQIKFGRVVEAEKALLALLKVATKEEKARILPIFADFNLKTGGIESAAEAIRECLSLEISDEARAELKEKLVLCERQLAVVPTEPDINAPELVKFIDEIEKFLTRTPHAEHKFVELASPQEVKRCAHDQNIDPPFFSWNAVRTSASKEMMNHVYAKKLILDSFNKTCLRRILEICRGVIPEGSPGYFYFDDIYADLSLIARGLLIGVLSHPLDKMKEAYEMSLFPCGWKGAFPDGELLVAKLW